MNYPFTLPVLPFDENDLSPEMTKETFDYHHKKHHNAYVVKLNELVSGTEYERKNLKDIICYSAKKPEHAAIFNNAAQIWNHDFFWKSMKKNGGTSTMSLKFKTLIDESFGSVENFAKKFQSEGVSQFGSGWVWLVQNANGKLEIIKTSNALTPLTNRELKPLLVADVWEHAYYIDFRNRRPDYLAIFLEKLANFNFAESNLK